jgi:hypothetical protein
MWMDVTDLMTTRSLLWWNQHPNESEEYLSMSMIKLCLHLVFG